MAALREYADDWTQRLHRAPNHQRFREAEGWTQVRDAVRRTGHHVTYELALPDGGILRTRISHPADRSNYERACGRIFCETSSESTRPPSGPVPTTALCPSAAARRSRGSLCLQVSVTVLVHQVGLTESEVALMTRDEAIPRVNVLWTTGA